MYIQRYKSVHLKKNLEQITNYFLIVSNASGHFCPIALYPLLNLGFFYSVKNMGLAFLLLGRIFCLQSKTVLHLET